MAEKYINAHALAKHYGVSMSTVRRRILEGKLFPGAKKVKNGVGEMWRIPRSEMKRVSLKDISPKLYQKKYENQAVRIGNSAESHLSSKPTIQSLEERVATLERLYIKLLAR